VSIPPQTTGADATLRALAEQVHDLATEIGRMRESLVTAAEWDSQMRTDRQQALDQTLATVRIRLGILTIITLVLLGSHLLIGLWFFTR
jgi:hypothetical protein